jgi:hypothetical protein
LEGGGLLMTRNRKETKMSEMTAKENEILIKLIINLVETSKDKDEAVKKLKALLDTDK